MEPLRRFPVVRRGISDAWASRSLPGTAAGIAAAVIAAAIVYVLSPKTERWSVVLGVEALLIATGFVIASVVAWHLVRAPRKIIEELRDELGDYIAAKADLATRLDVERALDKFMWEGTVLRNKIDAVDYPTLIAWQHDTVHFLEGAFGPIEGGKHVLTILTDGVDKVTFVDSLLEQLRSLGDRVAAGTAPIRQDFDSAAWKRGQVAVERERRAAIEQQKDGRDAGT